MKRIANLLKASEKKGYLSFVKEDYLIGEFLLAILFIIASILLPFFSSAQKAKDGTYSYSPGSSTTVIPNRYSALASSASSGATSVTVSNISELAGSYSFTNSTNAFATDALSAGDLVMIIQMQGATITTTDNSSYGAITAYNNTGNYEVRTVSSVSSNTINFCVALTNSYSQTGTRRSQVVRIPRFNNITLGSNAIVAAMAWNGSTGGVCSMEMDGNLSLSGSITASGLGFRGGVDPDNTSSSTAGGTAVTLYRTTATTTTAGKGESIAGNSSDYNSSMNGAYGRGAAANGGGGGNGHNAGGGGGSNGTSITSAAWNGTGIKPSGYNSAWNQEVLNFATDLSWGGGRGGYTYGANNQIASSTPPGNTGWGGDYRQNVGGFGGRPLDYSTNTRLFMGGGGGAGDGNNGHSGAGGNGGGIVYLLVTGTVSGTGAIVANGANGSDASGSDDGPGGAGGGGAIIVLGNSTITGISISANGGNGGNQPSGGGNESEGPGGGGGGGYVFTTTTSVTINVNGGNNGTTGSSALTEFPPNGATKGDAGAKLTTGTFLTINDCFKEINGLNSPSCSNSSGSIAASGTIINSYYAGTASASAGATRISVGSQRSGGSSAKISPGDLLLVIQMQGATINSTNTSSYGSGTAGLYSGYTGTVAGTYEYVYAASGLTNNTVYLITPLKYSYTSAAASGSAGQYTFQVVRVPQYSSLNIAASASITVAEWNGSTGGIIAANVSGTMTLNGGTAITAAALGFRGGGGRQLGGGSGATTDVVTLSSNNANGSKGEGIAGTPKYTRSLANTLVDNGVEGYPNGSYAQGAPGNAGGGGTDGRQVYNDENTGGGGGGNGGAGGRGGRAWADPSVYGGYGGSVFSQASMTRLVMGGGGGAGTTNDGTGPTGTAGFSSSGGSGGGMIFLKVNAVSGSGTINADGATGLSVENDGAGAGGAGGSVYLYSNNTAGLANVTIYARGGGGGSAWAGQPNNGTNNDGDPEHGPGGGGGGGVIYTNGTINASSSVAGGAAGITTTSNLNYGAANGNTGIMLTSGNNIMTVVKTYCDIDDDNDGILDTVENPSSSVDPFDDADNDGIPNAYDSNSGTSVAWADTNGDGINDNYDADKDGKINELDIDSDNDGITDNIEAQSTSSYKLPTDTDANADGLIDVYAGGLTPYDYDSDGIPDYLDTDSDNDGVPDRNEGADRNYPAFLTHTQTTIDASGDTDGDGLMDVFDNVNYLNLTTNFYTNVAMGNMGPLGNYAGPNPSGSLMGLQQSNAAADRDWRNASILPMNIISFSVNYLEPTANLKWEVVNELQTANYEVEMSTNGINFSQIKRVSAKNTGNSTYTYPYSLANQTSGTVYFKIKQTDKDGKVYYTNIVPVKIVRKNTITVSPNPFQSHLNVTFSSETAETVTVSLLSMEGKTVTKKQFNVSKGQNTLLMDNLSNLSSGTYNLLLQYSQNAQVVKVLKFGN